MSCVLLLANQFPLLVEYITVQTGDLPMGNLVHTFPGNASCQRLCYLASRIPSGRVEYVTVQTGDLPMGNLVHTFPGKASCKKLCYLASRIPSGRV